MSNFQSFVFQMRFDKQAISKVSHDEQIERIFRYLHALGELRPLLGRWFLQADSLSEALSLDVMNAPHLLEQAVAKNFDADFPAWLSLSVWNGEQNPLKGGLSFQYDAHDMESVASMGFEDAGALVMALDDPQPILLAMMRIAVSIWPEIDWGVIAPEEYYLDGKVFPDRQTIGWIGFCPHALRPSDYPDATVLLEVPGRGTLVVTCPEVMDPSNREHFRAVGTIDTKLVELDYLPMFNN
ncbi:Imm52 family immunity protein [Stutzerimonas nitrititolerans]|uniref:Imm52 family immunity protein n=1 Tax=Stutzerimonas nitrititolerans TaxID=2482751 RepID=UPI00289C8F5A|nr:Imm52 family immunity protein [Stutzerimonas nitrititolerans]